MINSDLAYNDDSDGIEVLVENHYEKELEKTSKSKVVPDVHIQDRGNANVSTMGVEKFDRKQHVRFVTDEPDPDTAHFEMSSNQPGMFDNSHLDKPPSD